MPNSFCLDNPLPLSETSLVVLTTKSFLFLARWWKGTQEADVWSSPQDMLKYASVDDGQREREVQSLLRALFDKLRHQCVCDDGLCAIHSGTRSLSGDPAPACQTQRCQICRVFEAQPHELYRRSLPLRNQRLNQLLCCCPAVSQLSQLAKASATLSPAETVP